MSTPAAPLSSLLSIFLDQGGSYAKPQGPHSKNDTAVVACSQFFVQGFPNTYTASSLSPNLLMLVSRVWDPRWNFEHDITSTVKRESSLIWQVYRLSDRRSALPALLTNENLNGERVPSCPFLQGICRPKGSVMVVEVHSILGVCSAQR